MKGRSNFHASGNRVYFQWDRMNMPPKITEKMGLETLYKIGFAPVDIKIVDLARKQVGSSKYNDEALMYQAPKIISSPSFVKWIYGMRGIQISFYTGGQYSQNEMNGLSTHPPISDKIDGCLIFTKGPAQNLTVGPNNAPLGHVGILTAKGTIIHGWPGKGVVEEDLTKHLQKFPLVGTLMMHDEIKGVTLVIPDNQGVDTDDDLRCLILEEFHMMKLY